ncbi:MAG: hypothetical protein WC654_02230 [Patescibacteria group bacterium]
MRTSNLFAAFVLLISTPALATEYFLDNDGDGYGQEIKTTADDQPTGYADKGGDCDDANKKINPGVTEDWGMAGDGIDQDCDGDDKPLPTLDAKTVKKFQASYPTMTRIARLRTYGYCAEASGCSIDNEEGKFAATEDGMELCDMTVTRGYWKIWPADQCQQTAGLINRGGGGIGKKTVQTMIDDGTKPIIARIDNLEAHYKSFREDAEGRLAVLEVNADIMDKDIDRVFDATVNLGGGKLSDGTVVKPMDSRVGVIEVDVADLETSTNRNAVSLVNLGNDVDGNGLVVLGSVGGVLGYQRPYAVRKGGEYVRNPIFGGGGVGGFIGARYDKVQLGFSVLGAKVYDPSFGNDFMVGLEMTYFPNLDGWGYGGFVGGGSHESGGTPPVETAVIGRYGLIGIQGVYSPDVNGYFMFQFVPRLSAGLESFGTKANDGTQDIVDAQVGGIVKLDLELRFGVGPKGR